MSNLPALQAQMGQLSTAFAGQEVDDSLGAGILGGFGRIGYKGKVWSIHHRGESRQLLRDDGDGPRNSIEVVILKASPVLSKTWYEGAFVEGSSEAPDCFSSNGVTPDPASPKPQCTTCAVCPRNQWGSAVRQDGTAGKGKACSDAKRLAVVPLSDIKNDVFDGPMLLRVPPASLQDLATYDAATRKLGYPYFAIGTRIAFDPKDAAPKFVFTPIRALTDEEAAVVVAHRNDPSIERILAENMVSNGAAAPAQAPIQFEQPPQQPAPAALVTPQVTAPPVQPQAPAAQAPATTAPKATRTTKPKAAAPAAQVQAPVQTPVQAGGFGPVSSAGAANPAPANAAPEITAGADAAFTDDLDKKLEALMG